MQRQRNPGNAVHLPNSTTPHFNRNALTLLRGYASRVAAAPVVYPPILPPSLAVMATTAERGGVSALKSGQRVEGL